MTATTPSRWSDTDLQKHRWFSLGYNGQLANYAELRRELLADGNSHLTCENDTEIIAHEISRELSREGASIWWKCFAT